MKVTLLASAPHCTVPSKDSDNFMINFLKWQFFFSNFHFYEEKND